MFSAAFGQAPAPAAEVRAVRADLSRRRGNERSIALDYIIRWIEQRGIGTYDVGWVCV
jgi:hypothetical protein